MADRQGQQGKEQGSLTNIRPQQGDTGRDGTDAGMTSIEGNFKLSVKTKLPEAHPAKWFKEYIPIHAK